MREWNPCYWNEEKFYWSNEVFSIYETWDVKVIATPVNPICNSCNHFKECLNKVVEWAKEQEEIEMAELFSTELDKSKLH